jgi:hypothetical protein
VRISAISIDFDPRRVSVIDASCATVTGFLVLLSHSPTMSSVPPPLPPRQPSFVGDASTSEVKATDPDADALERGMSEEQLRELYDSEEIDRFLSLFSAVESPSQLSPSQYSICMAQYVTEVQLQDDTIHARMDASTNHPQEDINTQSGSVEVPVISRPPSPSSLPGNRSLCEEIALVGQPTVYSVY